LSASLLLAQQYKQAGRCLIVDGELPSVPRFRQAMFSVLFQWSESITPGDDAALVKKLALLDHAMKLQPNDVRILQRIAELAETDGEAGDRARRTLKGVLASGQSQSVVHFALGLQALKRGDQATALRHWDLANRSNPDTPVALNNLAVLVSRQEPPDLERALELIDKAIELNPKIAEFYDSRGQIHLMRKDYTEAIADLEFALQRMPGRADIHRRLAVAYESVGDAEIAKMHFNRAASIEIDQPKK
jgi:tetratricopeptide (TPR) repeat protein